MATNKTLKSGFELWQEYAQAYTDFVIEATQHTLEQSLAARERLDKVWTDTVKKAQALTEQEQEIALGLAEVFQAQAKSVSERLSKLMETPAAKN